MPFRPGMTRSGARQPGAVRSHNTHERQVSAKQTNDQNEAIASTGLPRAISVGRALLGAWRQSGGREILKLAISARTRSIVEESQALPPWASSTFLTLNHPSGSGAPVPGTTMALTANSCASILRHPDNRVDHFGGLVAARHWCAADGLASDVGSAGLRLVARP